MAAIDAAGRAPPRRLVRDPALLAATLLVAALLLFFVVYPLLALIARVFVVDGAVSAGPLMVVLQQPGHRAAFANSLLLATLVGAFGTALGFLFAFTAARSG
ncbi:MAG: hypothetical protein AB7O45_16590, partial [Alphaproteobacteria bacterium]